MDFLPVVRRARLSGPFPVVRILTAPPLVNSLLLSPRDPLLPELALLEAYLQACMFLRRRVLRMRLLAVLGLFLRRRVLFLRHLPLRMLRQVLRLCLLAVLRVVLVRLPLAPCFPRGLL
jgi:hypothetical protein